MAKNKETKEITRESLEEKTRLDKYIVEFDDWFQRLQPIHVGRFVDNYDSYTATTKASGTRAAISDPIAPELIERVVQRMFEKDPKFFAVSRGDNLPPEIVNVLDGTARYLWNNPDMIQSTGTMRSKLKVGGREFCVLGNLAVETFYNAEADTPDMRIIPLEDVIFDPTKTLRTSKTYYITQFVDIDELKEHKEVEKDGKIVKGIFKNVDEIERIFEDNTTRNEPTSNVINRGGDKGIENLVKPIELISRWEGNKCTRFVKGLLEDGKGNFLIQEWTNTVLDDDPLDFSIDKEVPKQPYGFSLLDSIAGLTDAKDLILNQVLDYGSKALNPPIFVDPSISPINRKTLSNAFKIGGIVFASPGQIDQKQMPSLPNSAFETMTYIQTRAESVTGIGSYLGGVPNQTSDRTRGTKGGIELLMGQAVSPVKDRQINLEESIIEPVINKMVKMAAASMAKDDIKWVMITGESPRWIKVTRGLLTGKITVDDLVSSEIWDQEKGDAVKLAMQVQGKDPNKELVYDADWLIRVEAGSLAEVDTEKEIQNFKEWVGLNAQFGVQQDMRKISLELARKAKIKEADQYLEEQQQPVGIPPQGVEGELNKPPVQQGI